MEIQDNNQSDFKKEVSTSRNQSPIISENSVLSNDSGKPTSCKKQKIDAFSGFYLQKISNFLKIIFFGIIFFI